MMKISARGPLTGFPDWPDSKFYIQAALCLLHFKKREKIPTLREALDAVVYETKHKVVWLDMKVPNLMNKVIPIQKEFLEKAKAIDRTVEILLGIPDDITRDDYLKYPEHETVPSLWKYQSRKQIDATQRSGRQGGHWAL